MKLVKSSVNYFPQFDGEFGICQQIEKCGRICYKSEDKITYDSAFPFVERMIKSKHYAMLEHGTVYLKIPLASYITVGKYLENPYSIVVEGDCYYITTNYRVIIENEWREDMQYLCDPESYHVKRYTFKFTGDIGVMREALRHRKMSFAQESTRYCKYKEHVTYVIPSWLNIPEGNYTYWDGDWCDVEQGKIQYANSNDEVSEYLYALSSAERSYKILINKGWKPQQARVVLPLNTKTETCVTGFAPDWRYILDLRLFEETGAPHPDMVDLMEKFEATAKEACIWNDIMSYKSVFE